MSDNLPVIKKEELDSLQVIAKSASNSKFFQNLGGEAGMFTLMLYGKELGLNPMQSITGINIIQGKPEISPRLMNILIRQKGHKLNIKTSSDILCEIEGERFDTKEKYCSRYSIEEAERAGLVREGGPWTKYPSDMLFKSCLSRLARRLFPDVVLTSYVEGEISSDENSEEIIEVKKTISPEQVNLLSELIKNVGGGIQEKVLSVFKISMIEELPEEKYSIVFNALKKELEKKSSVKVTEVTNV